MPADNDVTTAVNSATPLTGPAPCVADCQSVAAIQAIRDTMPSAPVCDDALMPVAYRLDADAGMICKAGPGAKTPTPLMEPVLVVRTLEHDTGGTHLELAALVKDTWRTVTVPAELATSRRELVRALASLGVTADEANGHDVLEFIRAYRRVNRDSIPVARVHTQAGWCSPKQPRAFALGLEVVGPGSACAVVHPPSDGEMQILAQYAREGSEDETRRILSLIPDGAPAWVTVYAAILPMLLKLLRRETVIFAEIIGDTSTGKTTVLTLAASLFGRPGGNGRQGLIAGWQQTDVALERRATLTPDTPLFFDESTAETGPRMARILYALSTGQGRGRGSIEGLRAVNCYAGVVMSTGESSLLASTSKGGIAARTVTISEPPFGVGDQARLVHEIGRVCPANYGHLARRVAEHLAGLEDADVAMLDGELADLESRFRSRASNQVSGRMAGTMAIIALAGKVLHRVVGIEGDPVARVEAFWQRTADAYAAEVPLLQRVYDFITSWFIANRSMFAPEAGDTQGSAAPGDCWGLADSRPQRTVLTVARDILDKALAANGFDVRVAMTEMKRIGCLLCEAGKNTTRRVLPGGARTACYVIALDDEGDAASS